MVIKLKRIESEQFSDFYQQIDDIELFQGDTVTLPFQFTDYNEDVIPLIVSDKSKTSVEWRLCPYGQPQNPILQLKSTQENNKTDDVYIDTDTNVAYVNLDAARTRNLIYGKYTQQIILHYDFGDGSAPKDFLRAQGFMNFKNKIQDFF